MNESLMATPLTVNSSIITFIQLLLRRYFPLVAKFACPYSIFGFDIKQLSSNHHQWRLIRLTV